MRLAFWRAVAEIGRRMTEAGERRVAPPRSIVEELYAISARAHGPAGYIRPDEDTREILQRWLEENSGRRA